MRRGGSGDASAATSLEICAGLRADRRADRRGDLGRLIEPTLSRCVNVVEAVAIHRVPAIGAVATRRAAATTAAQVGELRHDDEARFWVAVGALLPRDRLAVQLVCAQQVRVDRQGGHR